MIATLALISVLTVKQHRELPVETLCVRDGFTVYNGMTTEFKRISKGNYSMMDWTYTRKRRNIEGECYRFINGTFDDGRKK